MPTTPINIKSRNPKNTHSHTKRQLKIKNFLTKTKPYKNTDKKPITKKQKKSFNLTLKFKLDLISK